MKTSSMMVFGRRAATHLRDMSVLAAALLLAGCASLGSDAGLDPVRQVVGERLGTQQAQSLQARPAAQRAPELGALLAAPITVDSAVQIALLNHPGLQADLHGLGVSEAELVQASRLPNPGFSWGRSRQGHEREIERGLGLELGHLLALPLIRQAQSQRLAAAQLETAQRVLSHVAETRKAFYTAVAAQQTLAYQRDVQTAAEAGAELARRMAQTGNWSALQQAREHAFYAEAALGTARAERALMSARERLSRLLGLWGAQTDYRLSERLPDLPASAQPRPALEQEALGQRLDLRASLAQTEALARQLGLQRATRWVNVLELDLLHANSNEAPRKTGFEFSLQLPLFDWGDARVARAERQYMQNLHRSAQIAVEARSELREAYQNYRAAHDVARHYRDELVPLARRVSEQNLLRYNGMFIGVFELLADTRAQIGTVNASIEALRDFWLAQADYELAQVAKPALGGPSSPKAAAAAAGADH